MRVEEREKVTQERERGSGDISFVTMSVYYAHPNRHKKLSYYICED